ncbi:MAG: hypothetical protein OEM46_05890 [Ignavibacteria bacterium]|nr:hypothetical protein [Ignavibacteria bacterium]
MSEDYRSPSKKMSGCEGRNIFFSLIFTLTTLIPVAAQSNDYWLNAPLGTTKIFTISFADVQNGEALTEEGDVLITTDGGISWADESNITLTNVKSSSKILWQADIYCAIMKSTDGGNSWLPYNKGKQQHFCGVYLKDDNTGYKVASDFLNKVINEIRIYSEEDKLESLLDHPQQCTEYYRNADEGWAVGWCIRNFNKSEY